MDIDQVKSRLVLGEFRLPEEELRWTLDHWEEFSSQMHALLQVGRDDFEQLSQQQKDNLFFYIFLAAEKRDTRVFGPLCECLKHEAAARSILGDDTVCEGLPNILISVFDGKVELLTAIIENPMADEYIRSSVLDAYAYLCATKAIPQHIGKHYIANLHRTLIPREACFVWVAWVNAVAALGLSGCRQDVAQMLENGFVDSGIMNYADFESDLEKTLRDPTGTARFADERIGPYGSVIEDLSTWYCFSERAREDQKRIQKKERGRACLARGTASVLSNSSGPAQPRKKVGRNDPCPCGSGKKFKKCCLQ